MSIFNQSEQYKTLQEAAFHSEAMQTLRNNKEAILGAIDGFVDHLVEESIETLNNPKYDPIVLQEQLTDNETYKADRMKESGHHFYNQTFLSQHPQAEHEFMQQASKEGRGRIRIPLTLENTGVAPNSEVKSHLQRFGYETDHESYAKGLAHTKITVGNPEKGIPYQEKKVSKRIGSVLEDTKADPRIKRAYTNDPARSSAKTSEYDLLITHHPHDIYGMSTDRGWMSCSNMRNEAKSDAAARKMKEEINNQTHVAYLLPKGGNVDHDAIARMKLSRHNAIGESHSTIIPEGMVYGDAPSGFRKAVEEHTSRLFPARPGAIYKKNSDIYSDNGRSYHFPEGETKPEHLDAAWKATPPKDEARNELLGHVVPGQKYKSKMLNAVSQKIHTAKQLADAGQFPAAVSKFGELKYDLGEKELRGLMHARTNQGENLYQSTVSHIASSVRPEHHEHVASAKAKSSYSAYDPKIDVLDKAHRKIAKAPINTVDDAVRQVKYMNKFYSDRDTVPYDMKFQIGEKHKMGGNVFHKIIKGVSDAGELNPKSFQHVYMSAGKEHRSGNLYDSAVKINDAGIPESSMIMNHLANTIKGMNSENRATMFYHSKPDTRKIFGSLTGLDPKKMIDPYRKKLKEREAYLESLKKRAVQEGQE